MGIFDTIKNIYKKADTAVGGYLPGGSTPQEVKESKTIPTTETTAVTPTSTPADSFNAIRQANELPKQGSSGSSSGPLTPTPTGPVSTSTNVDIPRAQIQPATGSQKFYSTPVGQFVSGVKDPTSIGQDLGPYQDTGAVVGGLLTAGGGELVAGAGKAIQGITGIVKGLTTAKNTRTAVMATTQAEQAGQRILAAGGGVKVGSKFGALQKTITNSKQAKMINDFIINTAAKVSPKNYLKILGWGAGLGTTVAGISLWSGFGVRNSYSDGQQQLGIMIANAYKDGNIELGDELQELADDRTAVYNELNPIWSNPVEAGKQIGVFVDTVKEANEKVREDEIAKLEEQQAKDQLIQDLQQKLLSGQGTPEDKEALNELVGGFQSQEDFETELENRVDTARLEQGNIIAERIINDRMTAEEIINDEEIRAFALDPNNQFSAVAKLYTEAITATGRDQFCGEDGQGGPGGSIEPPSTLGFGLLQTGNEYKENEETTDPQLVEQKSLNERALDIYGLRFEQLTDAQKATLEQ